TDRELAKLRAREGLRQRHLELTLGDGVRGWLAARGVEPRYGARPLKRVIERSITVPLARTLSATKSAPPVLEVGVAEDGASLALVPRDAPERTSEHDVRPPSGPDVRALVDAIDRTRFRASRWLRSDDLVELAEELRLLDQLAQHKAFWENRTAAEARMAGVADRRALVERWRSLDASLASLEDLAFEALWARDARPAAHLAETLAELVRDLEQAELDLAGRRHTPSDRATLFLVPARGSASFLRSLVELYAELCRAERWTFAIHEALRPDGSARTLPGPEDRSLRELSPAHQAEAKAAARAAREQRAAAKAGRERVSWRHRAELRTVADLESETALPALLRSLGTPSDEAELALVIEGRHAATLLAFEEGEHHFVSGTESKMVRVVVRPSGASLPHPADLGGARPRVRTFQENKRIVIDHVLDIHLPVAPRAHRIYRQFIARHVVRSVLGPAGHAWADAWGAR
ncbi:hypothetical protein L6R52_09820, partial [Myxococcota bacterium]|nr:hypothetical protein [Myxococcota bacterium]